MIEAGLGDHPGIPLSLQGYPCGYRYRMRRAGALSCSPIVQCTCAHAHPVITVNFKVDGCTLQYFIKLGGGLKIWRIVFCNQSTVQ